MGHGESQQRGHDTLERGRESYARRGWRHSYRELSLADRAVPLGAGDLELLATSAYMLGRDDEHLRGLERAHQAYLDAGDTLRAARCAFWVGMHLSVAGEMGRASGWLGSLLLKLIMPSYVPLWAPVAGFVASVGIGMIFGLWPAWKAARLDPIESLRYE